MPDTLTGVQKKLLKVINDNPNQWLSRSDIAELVGKNALNPNDRNLLTDLGKRGLIEIKKTSVAGAIGFQWEYKAL